MRDFLGEAIANTRETIVIAKMGLAADKNRDYYDPEKREMVEKVLKQGKQRLKSLLAMQEEEGKRDG